MKIYVQSSTEVRTFQNLRNPNKMLEVHDDGYGHISVRQYMKFQNGVANSTGDGNLHRIGNKQFRDLIQDYEEIVASNDMNSENFDPFSMRVYKMRRNINDIPEQFLNGYCIYTTYFHQYTEGIGGSNTGSHLYIDDSGQSYEYKKDANTAAKLAGIRPINKKGRGDKGYGDVGAVRVTVEILKVIDAINLKSNIPSYEPSQFEKISSFRG